MDDVRAITISTRTLLVVLALAVVTLVLFAIRDVLVTVFVALVLSAAFDPWLVALERLKIPRPLGIALLFLLVLGVVIAITLTLVPLALDQGQQFAAHVPELYGNLLARLRASGYDAVAAAVENAVHSMSEGIGETTRSFFGGALSAVRGALNAFGVLVLTFYMAMQQKEIKATALDVAPARYRASLSRLSRQIKTRLGQWLRGQLLLGAVIGSVSYAGLMLLGVKFALVLALLAGVTEMIPVIGPIVGAIPAILVAASDRPVMGLWVGVMYIGIQQLENHLLVPRIMASATGLNPITVLVGVLIGAKLAGVMGVFLAVPASIIVQACFDYWMEGRKLRALGTPPVPEVPPAPG